MKTITEQQEAIERIKQLPYNEQKKYTHVSDYFILMAFFEILKFTDKVFLTDVVKGEIFIKTEIDFFKREHKDEEGNKTKGIKTFWQLEQFVIHYNKQLEIFREKMFLHKVNEYNKLDLNLKKAVISKDLYAFGKFNLITGGSDLTKKISDLAKLEMDYLQTLNEFEPKKSTGFKCSLFPEITKKIYYFMAEKYIRGDLKDFQAIFSNESNTVNNPIIWLILNERGTKPGRGNQTSLFIFLELMLGKISNEYLRKAKDLFVDEKGTFIEKQLLKPDRTKILTYKFETGINELLNKADQK